MKAALEWRPDADGQLRAYVPGRDDLHVTWAPQPGSQQRFLDCGHNAGKPERCTFEVLYEGTRGPGKTDALLMDFAQFVGRGFGRDWRGILFRRTFPELADIIAKSLRWYTELFPGAVFNRSNPAWTFPGGEHLAFRVISDASDYYTYHGHAYPWIGWEELTNWPSDECYKLMFSCVRSANPRIPRHVRATCNPYGVGHNWVKARFELPVPPTYKSGVGPVIVTEGQPSRRAIHGSLDENRILMHAEPEYKNQLRAAARNPSELAAWLEGSWDIVAGGMFDDLWTPLIHIVPPLPPSAVPTTWRLDRSFDWGQARPFSVGWWAQSNGDPVTWEGRRIGEVRGDLIRVAEWYGWNGQPNQGLRLSTRDISLGIIAREEEMQIRGRVRPGPADTAIWNMDPRDPSTSIALDMERFGVSWEQAYKDRGSREQGWVSMRQLMQGSIPAERGTRENPGLFVSAACRQFIRTIPVLPRDEVKLDDVDTEAEDHIADEARYRVRRRRVVETRVPHAIY